MQELIPNSVILHVFCDPRGVAQSFSKQPWAPSDLGTSAKIVRDIYIYCRGFEVRQAIDQDRLFEIRFE